MSHFPTYVLISNNTVDISDKAEDLLLLHCKRPAAAEYVRVAKGLLKNVLDEISIENKEKKKALKAIEQEIRRTARTYDQGTNGQAKLDWWEIGGRYSGVLTQANKIQLDNEDIVSVESLDLEKIPVPFAIITPDGAWHSQGEMGLGGRVANVDENWEPKAKALLAKHADTVLVVADCHI